MSAVAAQAPVASPEQQARDIEARDRAAAERNARDQKAMPPPSAKRRVGRPRKTPAPAYSLPSANAPTNPTLAREDAKDAELDEENIVLQQKLTTVDLTNSDDKKADESDDGSPLSDLEELERRESVLQAQRNQGKPSSGAEDAIMLDDPSQEVEREAVDEGSIDYSDVDPAELEDHSYMEDDQKSVVSISSDDHEKYKSEAKPNDDPSKAIDLERPWRISGFDETARRKFEQMYCQDRLAPLQGNWDLTEDYHREQDKEMLRYLEDFPLDKWLIDKQAANDAYMNLLKRTKWRNLSIGVYSEHRNTQYISSSSPFSRTMPMMQPQQGPPPGRQPSMGGPHGAPNGMPPQQMHHGPPSNGHGMPPPPQMLRSQPNPQSMPQSFGQTLPGQYQHPGFNHQGAMGPPPLPFGHPQHVGGVHGMAQHAPILGMPQPGAQKPQSLGRVNSMHQQTPVFGMPSIGGKAIGAGTFVDALTIDDNGPTDSKGRKRKLSLTAKAHSEMPACPIPPYPEGERPSERKKVGKISKTAKNRKNAKRTMRKPAEAEKMPWHRQIDFVQAKEDASWDESHYDAGIIEAMNVVRKKNQPVVDKIDQELLEKQKLQRAAKKAGNTGRNTIAAARAFVAAGGVAPPKARIFTTEVSSPSKSSEAGGEEDTKAEGSPRKKSESAGGEGNFSFASDADRARASELKCTTPYEVLDAAEAGEVEWELCKHICIRWLPGKKSHSLGLEQARFRIYDTLITRQQYDNTLVLTGRAAMCIIDFCPDMLCRVPLLRICSEAGCGNTEVRDRMSWNGCYIDKATVTKRIRAALGQKQSNNPDKRKKEAEEVGDAEGKVAKHGSDGRAKERYTADEHKWYNDNDKYFDWYIQFFGTRRTHRFGQKGGSMRTKSEGLSSEGFTSASEREVTMDAASPEDSAMSPAKRRKTEETDADESVDGDDVENDGEDAVSIQSDTLLDEIED
ncbi:hypothetical protein BAUCODRAFT_149005 [Baudoinia panamericana UAMH 10762]|uniref:Uncharacterized protein n=1 Tax=Baudoinia panamericana (strain UAMH 10762) TaxID=717646 RepID=M2N841_BAUPA|nr:uncharacterized protein BAUCODRAFT_149005 [Baudoinia panamericana UAMH 10762]EMC94965.1 hypothetical protein BAUCODRAFT_149005 [Baudoinia panamericana UAMH 10762]